MYNKEQKERFIKDYLRSRVIAQTSLYSLFRKTAPYEESLQKDCSAFSTEEVLSMYKGFEARSKFTVFNYNAILKAYCAWVAHYYGLENEIAYNNITTDMIVPLIPIDANKLLSKEDITDIVDQLYNESDKAIIELLFLGVAGKNMQDIYAVSEECIKGNQLVVNNKHFPLSEELRELLAAAFNETEIMSYGETARVVKVLGKGRLYKERSNTRGVCTEDSIFRYFYRKIQLFRDYLGVPGLTMKNISASGLWHYLNLGMQETGQDLRGFLRTQAGKELALRYGFSGDYYLDNVYAKYAHYLNE